MLAAHFAWAHAGDVAMSMSGRSATFWFLGGVFAIVAWLYLTPPPPPPAFESVFASAPPPTSAVFFADEDLEGEDYSIYSVINFVGDAVVRILAAAYCLGLLLFLCGFVTSWFA